MKEEEERKHGNGCDAYEYQREAVHRSSAAGKSTHRWSNAVRFPSPGYQFLQVCMYVCLFVCFRCCSFQEQLSEPLFKKLPSSNEERMERILCFHVLCSFFSVSSTTTTTVEELLLWFFSFQTFLLSALKESQKNYYYLQRR